MPRNFKFLDPANKISDNMLLDELEKNYAKNRKELEKQIFMFDRDAQEFDYVPSMDGRRTPEKEGMYLTIRCGLTGIYTAVNMWKDNKWQMCVLDGSSTIAFSRHSVNIRI